MGLTIRQLEIFEKVAAAQHITRASEQLYLSQSAVSMAVSELEKETGAPLFERRGKRLVINEKGRLMLNQVKKILSLVNSTVEMLKEGDVPTGILKVGASTTIGNYLLPSLIGSFMKQYPNTQVLLQVGNTQQIEAEVNSGNLDLGLVEGPFHTPSLLCTSWRDDELVVFTGPDHPWVKTEEVSLDVLASANWIVREEGSGTREVFEAAMLKQAGKPNIGLELGHTEAIKKAVEAGLGISCLSRLTVQRELEHRWLFEVNTSLDLRRPLSILAHREKYKTKLFNSFNDFLHTNK